MTVAAEPLFRAAPGWAAETGWELDSFGDIAAKVGADLGLTPDAEQRWLLDALYAEDDQGLPAAYEVCVVAPRQNLKSATLEIAALTDLFVFGVDLAVWTAHEFKTARKTFLDMRRRIMGHPDYAARATFETAHGKEAIILDTGERLEFHARSGGSGRGFTCRKITLDEWLFGQPGDLGALVPTMFTVADAQIRYGSSAGKATSAALRELRARGRAGTDPALAYVEYGATRRPCALGDQCPHQPVDEVEGCALDDRDLWWQSNCALWAGRATLGSVEKMRRSLPPAEFMREFFSWWEDPPNLDGGALNVERWALQQDLQAIPRKPLTFGVDIGEDRTASIGAAWRRPGGVHVMVTQNLNAGARVDVGLSPAQLTPRLVELCGRWSGRVALGGPSAALEDDLRRAGLLVDVVTASSFASACGSLDDHLRAGTIHHGNQSELNNSVASAKWRRVGTAGEGAWQLRDAPGIGPLAAVTRALASLQSRPERVLEPVAIPATVEASGLAAMTF